MPTQEHETTWRILAEHTKLLRWIMTIDERNTITRTDPNMPEATDPISDAALLVHNTEKKVVHAVVVEVQVSNLRKKARAWALYGSALSYRNDCPSTVIIIALTARMEKAVHRRIAKLKKEGCSFKHQVLGPEPAANPKDGKRSFPRRGVAETCSRQSPPAATSPESPEHPRSAHGDEEPADDADRGGGLQPAQRRLGQPALFALPAASSRK